MHWFYMASLSAPIAALCAGWIGGIWPSLALLWVTAGVFLLDHLGRRKQTQGTTGARSLPVLLAYAHLALIGLGLFLTAQAPLSGAVPLMLSIGLISGQISHPNAHELIHASSRIKRMMGGMIYGTLLIGHHVSAHLRVHHVHVATPADPNSARFNEGFYAFFARAWIGSFRAGFQAEKHLRTGKSGFKHLHPYYAYLMWSAITLTSAAFIAGTYGVFIWVFIAIFAQSQILLADYVQHYGLTRKMGANKRYEPVGPAHSWNAPHWYSSAMMLNAPRHSDHHINPRKSFPALDLTSEMPQLPHSLPVMAVIALYPPLWRRVMHPRLDAIT